MGDPMMHMGPMNPMMGMGFPMGAGRPPFMGLNGMEPFGGGGFQGPAAFGGGFNGGFGAVGGVSRGRPDQAVPFAGAAAPRGPQIPPAEELAPVRRTTTIMCAYYPMVHAFIFCRIICSKYCCWVSICGGAVCLRRSRGLCDNAVLEPRSLHRRM